MLRKLVFIPLLAIVAALPALAQEPEQEPAPPPQSYFSPAQIDDLMQPLALYPDPLLAQILPACAYPQELDDVAHFVQQNGVDGVDSQPWDPPVKAIAHYPDVISMLDQNLAWAAAVGQAFANQAPDVMASVQRLRLLASRSGNLVSGPQESVDVQGDYVTINPTNPGVVYVPQYDPAYVYQPAPYGYPRPGISFSVGLGTGAWLNYGIDWMGGYVVPYPAGLYWGAGRWDYWANGGGYTNVNYFHNTFNGNNQHYYHVDRQRFARTQLSPTRYNQARINDYRGNVPRTNPALPQWHGGVTPAAQGAPHWNPSGNPGYNNLSLPQRMQQQQQQVRTPASVTHGPQGVFNVQSQPQTQTYQQRGAASMQSHPNVTGFPPQQQYHSAPQQQRSAPQQQRSAPSSGHDRRGH